MRRPRILAISEIPTPYRLPLYRAIADRPELEFEVVFCAADQPDRPWDLGGELAGVPHRFLKNYPLRLKPRSSGFVYEINPEIVSVVLESEPDLLVIGGYAVFAEQVAIGLARAKGIPYILHSESHLLKPRSNVVRAAKRALLPAVVAGASAGLAVGSAAARYLAAYGLHPGRVRIFPNTIDVAGYTAAAASARARAAEIRAARNLPDRFHLFAGRLVEVKGVRDFLAARDRCGDAAPLAVFAGDGPLAGELKAARNVSHVGFQQRDSFIEQFALAEGTVVPTLSEPWGVVVNEALACGSPVIASDAVGAAEDLVRDGVNGRVYPAGDVAALAAVLQMPPPPGDPSRGRIERWTYDFALEQFLEAVRIALPGRFATSASERSPRT
jgi:glycosyltransferase involved in cell wall biosynthesis